MAGEPTVNEDTRDAMVRHSVHLDRLGTTNANKVKEHLDSSILELKKRLAETDFRTLAVQARRTTQLIKDLQTIADAASSVMQSSYIQSLTSVAQYETSFYPTLLEQQLAGVEFSGIVAPPTDLIVAGVTARPLGGHLVKTWFASISRSAQTRIEGIINVGITNSLSNEEIANQILGRRIKVNYINKSGKKATKTIYRGGVYSRTRNEVDSIVRTGIMNVSNHAREETFKRNKKLVKAKQFVATLDLRTTQGCIGFNGQVFKINEGPALPRHVRCRSVYTPVLASWSELGLKANEVSNRKRASMKGEVPEAITGNQWLNRLSFKEVETQFGRARAIAFKRGVIDATTGKKRKLDLKDMLDPVLSSRGVIIDYNELTLAEMARRENVRFLR